MFTFVCQRVNREENKEKKVNMREAEKSWYHIRIFLIPRKSIIWRTNCLSRLWDGKIPLKILIYNYNCCKYKEFYLTNL